MKKQTTALKGKFGFGRFNKRSSTKPKQYRSEFEYNVISKLKKDIKKLKVDYKYERVKLKYIKPCVYIPDIVLSNGIIVEIKGAFTSQDRKKHLLIKEQYPDLDIRFVFQRPYNKLYKNSNTTYADWCKKYGFKWAEKYIPIEWLKE